MSSRSLIRSEVGEARVNIGVSDYVSTSHFPVLLAQEMGFYEQEGVNVTIRAFEQAAKELIALRNGEIDIASVGAHHPLSVFKEWKGAKLLMAVGQRTPWSLVIRADLPAQRCDLESLKGLKIGAAPEPGKALLYILKMAGIDAARSGITVTTVPGALEPGACTGVAAAKALQAKLLDGFWANELGAALAVESGAGKSFMDVRHGDGPSGAQRVSFTALVATEKMLAEKAEGVGAVVRAVVRAQRVMRESAEQSVSVAQSLFPKEAAMVVPGIVKANRNFYHAEIFREDISHLHQFARWVGLLDTEMPYEDCVALQFRPFWASGGLNS